MKTCPFCAEEILDAAVVCKHCGRRMVASRWKWAMFLLTIPLMGVVAWFFLASDTAKYRAFQQRRADWHERCDVYVGKSYDTIGSRNCQVELRLLTAYGQEHGW